MDNALMKPKMTVPEMRKVFEQKYPGLVANKVMIGNFAKKNGYKYTQQITGGVIERFYYKFSD